MVTTEKHLIDLGKLEERMLQGLHANTEALVKLGRQLNSRMGGIEDKMGSMENRMGVIETKLDEILTRLP